MTCKAVGENMPLILARLPLDIFMITYIFLHLLINPYHFQFFFRLYNKRKKHGKRGKKEQSLRQGGVGRERENNLLSPPPPFHAIPSEKVYHRSHKHISRLSFFLAVNNSFMYINTGDVSETYPLPET